MEYTARPMVYMLSLPSNALPCTVSAPTLDTADADTLPDRLTDAAVTADAVTVPVLRLPDVTVPTEVMEAAVTVPAVRNDADVTSPAVRLPDTETLLLVSADV